MIIVSYDISNDKLRTRFSKYLSRFGHRLQYSVFEMYVGEIELKKIKNWIERTIKKDEDSVLIYELGALTEKNRMIYGLKYKETAAYNDKYRIL